jgi:hypothetical protein
MKIEQILNLISPEWREEFLRFIESGEADQRFLDYIDSDEKCQEAVDLAVSAQAESFEGLAAALQAEPELEYEEPAAEPAAIVSAKMADAMEAVLELPASEQQEAVKQASAEVVSSAEPERRKALFELLKDLSANSKLEM